MLDALQKDIAENSGIYLFPGLWLPESTLPDKKADANTTSFDEKIARAPSGIRTSNLPRRLARVRDLSWIVGGFPDRNRAGPPCRFPPQPDAPNNIRGSTNICSAGWTRRWRLDNVSYRNWVRIFPCLRYTLALLIFTQVVGYLWIGNSSLRLY